MHTLARNPLAGSQPTSPRPFSALPLLALKAEKHLRRFRLVGEMLQAGCYSLRGIAKKLELHPDGFTISTLCQLQHAREFAALLSASFGRDILLYRNSSQNGLPVMGLSEEGLEALRLTVEFLDELDRQTASARPAERARSDPGGRL